MILRLSSQVNSRRHHFLRVIGHRRIREIEAFEILDCCSLEQCKKSAGRILIRRGFHGSYLDISRKVTEIRELHGLNAVEADKL